MTLNRDFIGKTVVITGAAGGLGSTLASLFAERGARVVGCDQSPEALNGLPLDSQYIFDLLSPAEIEVAVNQIIDDNFPDIVINNAGWTRADLIQDLDAEVIEREVGINLSGVIKFTDPLAKAMAGRNGGSVTFVSSINAITHFGNPVYAAAKAGIGAYARALAVELGSCSVRANVVAPGSIQTPAWDHRLASNPSIFEKLTKLYPLGRIVNASEVAEAVAFLASERASGITGIVLPVDAGITAGNLPFIDDLLRG